MAGPRYICPKCGFKLRPSDLRREGSSYFQCPSCREKLRVTVAYRTFLLIGQVLIAIAVPFVLGMRDVLAFIGVAALAFFPAVLVFTLLMRSIYPARLEPCPPSSSDLTFTKGTRKDS
jgi:DNA-directed RNA polymerase subunit RPC12/RpoP